MQGAIDPDEVVWAVVASAVRSLLHFLYAWREPTRSFFHAVFNKGTAEWTLRPDWVQLGCWLFWFCAEVAVAVPFGFAWAGGLPYARALLEVWRGVSLLAAEALEIAVVAYPVYVALVDSSSSGREWVKFVATYSWVPVTLVHILQFSLGTWSLVQHDLNFIWSTPVSLHFYMFIASIALFIRSKSIKPDQGKRWYIIRFVIWMIVNFVAVVVSVVVSIVGCVYRWEAEHLIHSLLCMAVSLEYILAGPLIGWFKRRKDMKHGAPLTSLDPYPEGQRATRNSS